MTIRQELIIIKVCVQMFSNQLDNSFILKLVHHFEKNTQNKTKIALV